MVIWVVKFQEKEINLARFSAKARYTQGKLLYFVYLKVFQKLKLLKMLMTKHDKKQNQKYSDGF